MIRSSRLLAGYAFARAPRSLVCAVFSAFVSVAALSLTGCGGGGATGGSAMSAANSTPISAALPSDRQETPTSAASQSFQPAYSDRINVQGRWTSTSLNVYVPSEADVALATEAMQRWQSATGGYFQFALTSNPANAQITFARTPGSSFDPGKVGLTNFTFDTRSGALLSASIRVSADDDPVGQLQVATHEFGHALGINGHSGDPNDIMFSNVEPKATISTRDLNTLFWVYFGNR